MSEDVLLLLETSIIQFSEEQFKINNVSPIMQRFIMKSVYAHFERCLLDDIMQNSLKQLTATDKESEGER